MNLVLSISIVSAVAIWFALKEYPILFGVYVPTGAIKRNGFKWIVAIVMVAAMLLFDSSDTVRSTVASIGNGNRIDFLSSVVVMTVALVTVVVLERFQIGASICYAVLGALEGYKLMAVENFAFDFAMAGSWIAAPVVSFVLGALLYLIYKAAFGRSHIHFIRLSYYMRYAVIFGVALTAFAVGVNYGGLLTGIGILTAGGDSAVVGFVSAAVLALVLFLLREPVRRRSDVSADRYFDFTTQTVVSVGLAVASTLLLFSFDGVCSIVGLQATPLSVVTLVFGAQAGVGAAQRRESVEPETLLRTGFGLVVTPLVSMLVTYSALLLFERNGQGVGDASDLNIIAFAVLLTVVVAFMGYVRRGRRQKEATAKILYSQQQQLYENQRALNDMELKTILSENQGLHQTLEMKRKEIVNVALSISEQKEYLESLHSLVKELSATDSESVRQRIVKEMGQSLGQRLSFDQEIDTFYAQAEMLHKDFSVKLTEEFPKLTLQERRLATLLRLGFSSKYIATLMNITPKSVEINRYRLRRKLGLKTGDNLINYIKSI